MMLEGMGFRALATTSGGLAAMLGKVDRRGEVTRDETFHNARDIVESTSLPVSVDLEDGFGATASEVAATVTAAAATGAVGGSIEDATGSDTAPIREFGDAVERVTAAVEAARGLDIPFTVTARAENFLYGRHDLDDTVARLRAYADAGADVVYAPGLPGAEAIRRVCDEVGRPVNVLMGAGQRLSVAELIDLGVRRISLGSSLSRVALAAFRKAAGEVLETGTCDFVSESLSIADMRELMGRQGA